ncbi:hypothetical protein CR152_29245 [Massilia violaceinigra]|uniref:Transglutaminase-like domain-containing protein n=1 Tax=Massilia violaceinigra TaxID=2045208 RepID=A0A2D2DT53_9BURK|nr:transglutaminase domain-containing protein [Massilia violaceinigra]ATQ78143.1 hypothetical protein CR152_29245 [Massilia violaceinigra]
MFRNLFRNFTFQRTTASFVLLTFTSLTLSPLARAQNQYNAAEEAGLLKNANRAVAARHASAKVPTSDERAAKLLADIHEDLKVTVPQVALGKNALMTGKAKFVGHDLPAKAKNIRTKYGELKGLYSSIEEGFASTGQRLKDARLPQEILNRHALAAGQYKSRRAEFDRLMIAVEQSPDQGSGQAAALAELASFMVRHQHAKPHQYTDPNKLPFGMADAKTRAPITSKEQYQASLFPPKHNAILLAGPIPDGIQFTQTVLPKTPNAADLAQTDDVQITPAIHAQAALLNKNPVTIYNWVRNNILYIPSHGSIQGSEMTLENKRGNAIDTASLLIALYRASGIPARYVYGTIDIPATAAMNWVGGVSKPEAAQNLLGQGGIPNIGMTAGGVVQTIRMEHVWVQAYVDYIPSRGAVNKNPDTWVDLDASFKQYRYTKGMDINDKVAFDAAASLASIQQGATLNETQGYVQNINLKNLQSQIASHQTQLASYIDGQNPKATVRDVIGSQNVTVQSL